MAKLTIHAVCVVEGDPLDIMEHYGDAIEQMENAASAFGTADVRIVSVEGMDFEFPGKQTFLSCEGVG